MIKTLPSYFIWAFFAACNLAIAPLTEIFRPEDWGAFFVYWCFGMIIAQAGLIAIWFALWPEPSLGRTARCFGVASVQFAFWAIGYIGVYMASPHQSYGNIWHEVLLALFCLPAIQLAIQSPLWFARAVLRWRIEQPGESDEAFRQGNLTIRGLLAGTALVASSLALARTGLRLISGGANEDGWMALGVGVLAAAGIGLATLPPALIAILRARSPWIGSLFFLIYVSAVTAAVLCFLWLLGGPFWGASTWQMIGSFSSIPFMAAGLCIALLETHRRGLRLRWGREHEGPARQ